MSPDAPLFAAFVAGATGAWSIDSIRSVTGESLPTGATRLQIFETHQIPAAPSGVWTLLGVTSNVRYTNRDELQRMQSLQEGLGRSRSKCAALIPIRKDAGWWSLAQDQRREIFEAHSHHIAIGEDYLPQIARRLHHCRELAGAFDFLTWFEYAPEDSSLFEQLLQRLRASREWTYVTREVDIRLSRI